MLAMWWTPLVLAGCATIGATDPMNEARRQFARDDYCPLSRVTAKPAAELVGSPPPAVAADPARLAMWEDAAIAQAQGNTERQVFSVSGCGDRVNYTCWDYSGGHDGERSGGLGVVCMFAPGTAVPAPDTAVVSPRPSDSQQ